MTCRARVETDNFTFLNRRKGYFGKLASLQAGDRCLTGAMSYNDSPMFQLIEQF